MPKPILHTALFHYPHQLSAMLTQSGGNLHLLGAHHGGTSLVRIYGHLIYARLWLQAVSTKQKVLFASLVVGLPVAVFLTLFLLPRQVNYAFAGANCFSNPVILPNLVSASTSQQLSVSKNPTLAIGSFPIYSSTSCVHLESMPAENQQQSLHFKALGFLPKKVEVSVAKLPALTLTTDTSQPISPADGLVFNLDQPDNTFSYTLKIDNQTASCNNDNKTVSCSFAELKLTQGQKYQAEINRTFKDQTMPLASETVILRDPLSIVGSAVENGSIVYHQPKTVSFTTNKPVSQVGTVSLTSGETNHEVKAETSDKTITVNFVQPLVRNTNFKLIIESAEATDGAYLPEHYTLNFTTSGGPKVAGVNIASYNVSPSQTFQLNFDSAVSADQNLTDLISLSTAAGDVPSSLSVNGNTIFINPNANLPACTTFSLSVADGLANSFGVTGGSAWSYQSRTTCKQIFSVGTSVQGRDLTAYRFGSGGTKILFVGSMHGNERSSYKTLIAFVDELERRYGEIPGDKTIVIIPDINPDGYAHQTRTNASGVDLNRNFPSNDWSQAVHMPGGVYSPTGGGATPLSEPESSALASYVNSFGPRLVLTYHAVARTVIDNGAGDASAIAGSYSSLSGFAHYSHSHEDGIFNYPTTGEFETWLADKKAIPTLLVELATMSSSELSSQRSAMWAMVKL